VEIIRTGLLLSLLAAPVAAAEPLPRVNDVSWPEVRQRCRQLVALLKNEKALPPHIERRLTDLLDSEKVEPEQALERLQDLLDPLCLIAVHINPESRVKARRGPAEANLTRDRGHVVLVKVHNEGGITPPLVVSGEELRETKKSGEGRWLEASLIAPGKGSLSGLKLEYVVLRLTAHEAGKREATLKFDAGQGTQDLGFRAEVSILFRVQSTPRK
jgi:hypothetical protein